VLLRVDRRLVPPDEPVRGERQLELVRVHRPPNAVDTLSMIVVDERTLGGGLTAVTYPWTALPSAIRHGRLR